MILFRYQYYISYNIILSISFSCICRNSLLYCKRLRSQNGYREEIFMRLNLPADFLNRMRTMLGEEYEAFQKSYEEERQYGLRVNTRKISCEEFESICPFPIKKIPWDFFNWKRTDGLKFFTGDFPGVDSESILAFLLITFLKCFVFFSQHGSHTV